MIPNSWHKSTRSGAAGHCVQAFWQKSSFSNPIGNCVEVRGGDSGAVLVRDTKLGEDSPVLSFTETDWELFISQVCSGFLYPSGGQIDTDSAEDGDGIVMYDVAYPNTKLNFTSAEWAAFTEGVRLGEFDLQTA